MEKYLLNIYSDWLKIEEHFDIPVNIFVDNYSLQLKKLEGLNIAIVCEPKAIINNNSFFIENQNYFDVILTHDDDILKNCENAEFFEFGTCWIKEYDYSKKKNFEISFLVGGKNLTEGHQLRHRVFENRERIRKQKKIFLSSNYKYNTNIKGEFLYDKKEPLFYSQFHICIENTRENGWFTEKLIDCLYTKTVPIYWGCLDIDKWFDTKSILIAKDLDEIIEICNSINEETYVGLIGSIEDNYKRSLDFLNYEERVVKKIDEIIKRKYPYFNIIKKWINLFEIEALTRSKSLDSDNFYAMDKGKNYNDKLIANSVFFRAVEGTLSIIDLVANAEKLVANNQTYLAISLYRLWINYSESPLKYVAYFNLGVIFQNCGDQIQACNAYRVSIQLNPDFTQANINLTSLVNKNISTTLPSPFEELEYRFKTEVARWFIDRGDLTHRINYDLKPDSIVIDIGGYKGDWAEAIISKYKCYIYIFEPVRSFYEYIYDRFSDNNKVFIYKFGLGPRTETVDIGVNNDASSLFIETSNIEKISIMACEIFLDKMPNIDLIKINIEGGEYDLLNHLIKKDLISRLRNIQVQFHTFVPDCVDKRQAIRCELSKTHKLTYNYDFVWENWEKV